MTYFTSKTPLITDSWTYGGNYFKNPGENHLGYTNNHTHLHKYQGKWYIFYQTNLLEPLLGSNAGFRCIFADEIEVDEKNVVIHECIPTRKGVSAIKNLNPYIVQSAATSSATLGILYQQTAEAGHMVATVGTPCITAEMPTEGIIELRNAEFSGNANTLKCRLKGDGSVSLRLNDKDSADIMTITSTGDDWQDRIATMTSSLSGTHTIYLILKGNVQFDTWQFVGDPMDGINTLPSDKRQVERIYDLQGHSLSSIPQGSPSLYIVNGKKQLFK